MPRALQIVAALDPLSYGVDGLRESLTGVAHFGVPWDLPVLVVMTAALLSVGSYLFSKIQR